MNKNSSHDTVQCRTISNSPDSAEILFKACTPIKHEVLSSVSETGYGRPVATSGGCPTSEQSATSLRKWKHRHIDRHLSTIQSGNFGAGPDEMISGRQAVPDNSTDNGHGTGRRVVHSVKTSPSQREDRKPRVVAPPLPQYRPDSRNQYADGSHRQLYQSATGNSGWQTLGNCGRSPFDKCPVLDLYGDNHR